MERLDNYYHICTSGLCSSLMFRNEADYIDGMNEIPLCAIPNRIQIYCFCLMSNHVHFIVRGEYKDCVNFIRLYKKQRSAKLGITLGEAEICVKPIEDGEYLLTAIAYILRNPIAANIKLMPGEYRWSSAHLYFAERSRLHENNRCLSSLNSTDRRRILKSRQLLPDSYELSEDGFIHPSCYVKYHDVEKLYSSPKRLLYYLSKNQDLDIELETGIVAKTKYRDEELLTSLQALSMEKFRTKNFAALKIEDRLILAKELRRRYGAGFKQISRLTSLSGELIRALL